MKSTLVIIFFAVSLHISVHGKKIHSNKHKSVESSVSSSAESQENDKSDHLTFGIFSDKTKYFITRNKTNEKVSTLDFHRNMSTLYDGQTGDAFAFSYEDGRAVYIPGDVTDKTWNIKKQSYEEYFRNPLSAQELFALGEKQGFQFDPEYVAEDTAEKMSTILTSLSTDYSSQCEALAITLYVSKVTSNELKTALVGFEDVMGLVLTKYRGDFKWLIGMFQGLGYFFSNFDGGINALNKKHIRLNLEKIFNEETGFHVLIYFLVELNSKFDLGKTLNKFKSELLFFTTISKLGGEVNYGFDGVVLVVTEILRYNAGENSKENLVNILREYFNNPKGEGDNYLKQKWTTSIRDLQFTIKKLKLKESFKELVKLLKDILREEWVNNGVNMSKIVNIVVHEEVPGKEDSVQKVLNILEEKKVDQ